MHWPLNVSKLDTCLTSTSYMENISILFLEANAGHFKLGYDMVGSLIQIRPLQILTCRNSEYVGFADFKYGAYAQDGFLDISQILCTWGLGHSRWTYPIVVMAHGVSAGTCCVYSVPTRTSALTIRSICYFSSDLFEPALSFHRDVLV